MNEPSNRRLALPPQRFWSAAEIADAAVVALREEALLTPKPGLVDRRGSGAHRDMDLPLLLRSAGVLRPTFGRIARCAASLPLGVHLRRRLIAIGCEGEGDMLAATGGVNTHRGAIWSLGLLCAARAARPDAADAETLCAHAGHIARLPALAPRTASHGRAVFAQFGARGARGEAEDGFPHLHRLGLPALRAARARGVDAARAQLETLLRLIVHVEDTCVLFRGGRAALDAAQTGASRVLDAGLDSAAGERALERLERDLLQHDASPGGCADLLAATLLLDRFVPEVH